jgi:hypothetical protein
MDSKKFEILSDETANKHIESSLHSFVIDNAKPMQFEGVPTQSYSCCVGIYPTKFNRFKMLHILNDVYEKHENHYIKDEPFKFTNFYVDIVEGESDKIAKEKLAQAFVHNTMIFAKHFKINLKSLIFPELDNDVKHSIIII